MAIRSPFGSIEYRTHYRWAVVLVTVLFLVLLLRFFVLQIVRGGELRQVQQRGASGSERLMARRGLLLDRNGVILARNVETHDLIMFPGRVRNPEQAADLLRRLLWLNQEEDAQLRELIRAGLERQDRLHRVVIRRDLVSTYCPYEITELEEIEPRKRTLWSPGSGRIYESAVVSETQCPHDPALELTWNEHRTGARCSDGREYVSGSADPYDHEVLRERVWSLRCPTNGQYYNNEKAILEAHLYELPGFEVQTGVRRFYPYRNLTAHVTGYMSKVNARDIEQFEDRYKPSDRIGRTGMERALEEELRGRWGQRNYIVDRRGHTEVRLSDPNRPDIPVANGLNATLTIDIELQKLVRDAMRWHRSGASVVLDVESGDTLAMYSKPSYDPNLWSGRLPRSVYRSTMANPLAPMLNKALTAYAPGSVYKLVTATAGLHRGLTDFQREIECTGYKEYGGRRFHCHNRLGHGEMDLIHAMSRSCDTFFYQLGEELSMDVLHEYATQYHGYGQPTGIEISESVGIVPTKEWHRQREGAWMPGYTLSTAVGQKDIRATPLQVARSFAAFANGGQLRTAHLLRRLEDAEGNIVRVTRTQGEATLPITPEQHAALADSFWRVVNDEHGTAFDARVDGIEVSGKTGTAEAPERKAGVSEEIAAWLRDDHAWFAGYAPSRKPEVVVVVFLDHGRSGGKQAGPVAMKIFQGYFERRALYRADERELPPLANPITVRPVPGAAEPFVNEEPIDLD